MDKQFLGRAALETLRAVLAMAVFSLFALALAAVFVRAFALSQSAVTAINWSVKCVGVFVFSLLFIGKERALFKGLIAGVLSCIFTMLLFAMIGGGFYLDAFFLLELVVCAVLGGAGALLGAKLRKA